MRTGGHVGCANYQKLVDALGDEPLRASDGHLIARLLGAREDNLAVPGPLKVLDLGQTGQQLAVVEAVDADNLGGKLRVLLRMLLLAAWGGSKRLDFIPLDRPFPKSRSSRARDSGHCEPECGK